MATPEATLAPQDVADVTTEEVTDIENNVASNDPLDSQVTEEPAVTSDNDAELGVKEPHPEKTQVSEEDVSSGNDSDPFEMVKKEDVAHVKEITPDSEDISEPELAGDEEKAAEEWMFVLGHDKLKKKVLKPGQGVDSRPVQSDLVTVRCEGRLEDDTPVDCHQSLTFTLGDGDVIQALDLCVGLMQLGEVSSIITQPQYAHGSIGREPDVPPNAVITYQLELLSVQPGPNYKQLSLKERVQHADKKRARGNDLFQRGEHAAAINSYTRALQIVDDTGEDHSGEETSDIEQLVDTRVKCYTNLAAAQIKIEAWDAAIKSCNDALKLQPANVKALFRKGKCLAGSGDVDTAIICLKKALNLDPESKVIHQELQRLTQRQKAQQSSERELYKKMLGTEKSGNKADKPDGGLSWWKIAAVGAVVVGIASVVLAYYRSS